MQDIRITKGIARYTSNFNVPKQPFIDGNRVASIGSQTDTVYQRSSKNFVWYKDGRHSNTPLDPGFGGSTLMTLTENGLQVKGNVLQSLPSSATPLNNGDMVFQASNNTTLTVKYKGTDGIVRSGTINLT